MPSLDRQELSAPPLDRLKAHISDIGDSQGELLAALLDNARDYILAYTNRNELPPGLESAQVQLALIAYNRQGVEGEQSHSEGGASRTFDNLPAGILPQLDAYRLLRMVRRA